MSRVLNRPLALALLAAVLAIGAFVAIRRPTPRVGDALPGVANPGHFVGSDVARLGATGRPQLVELFHYG